jgi:hypothetical protein
MPTVAGVESDSADESVAFFIDFGLVQDECDALSHSDELFGQACSDFRSGSNHEFSLLAKNRGTEIGDDLGESDDAFDDPIGNFGSGVDGKFFRFEFDERSYGVAKNEFGSSSLDGVFDRRLNLFGEVGVVRTHLELEESFP